MPGNTPRTAAAKKIQKLFRRKRVFTENVAYGGIKVTKSSLVSTVCVTPLKIDLDDIFDAPPKGFQEVLGYVTLNSKPKIRWTHSNGWLGIADGVKYVVAKNPKFSVLLGKDELRVSGQGNYEEAWRLCVKNGWAPASIMRQQPTFKIINGRFTVNKHFNLDELADSLKAVLPASMIAAPIDFKYDPGVKTSGLLNLTLKLKKPKLTYQFFQNGTVMFSGLTRLSDIEVPKELFKQFFTKWNLDPAEVFMGRTRIQLPVANSSEKKAKLAMRYPRAAMTWNNLPTQVPQGYYIRPGSNGEPRLYPYQYYRQLRNGPTVLESEVPLGPIAPKVVKAFLKIGRPIPESTRKIFANAGAPLENVELNKTPPAAHANRRAPSWNATKPGFYVRPGAGQQPYWFRIPKGLASGRKTVIAAYTKAGRNIPKAVREIFKIGNNVTTASNIKNHRVEMGLNHILRINGRQATRLTKKELVAVARNLLIAEVGEKNAPATIIQAIQQRALPPRFQAPIRAFNVEVNGTQYAFLSNGRVQKTKKNKRTERNWATIPVAEQNALAKALLPANQFANWEKIPKANKFQKLVNAAVAKAPPSPPKPKTPTPSPSSVGSSTGNLNRELEYAVKLSNNLGNLYREGNELNFLKVWGKLPAGKRGAPLKANVNRAYAKFVKTRKVNRELEAPKARYRNRINVPNWVPANLKNTFKNFLVNQAFAKPRKTNKAIKEALSKWINVHVPGSPARAARTVENMLTGEIRQIPARQARPRPKTPPVPKRSPPPKKSPKGTKPGKSQKNNYAFKVPGNMENLQNALVNLGLDPKKNWTWNELVRAGLNSKFKSNWNKRVAIIPAGAAVGPIKRPLNTA